MNEEIKKQWTAALRSGEFKQVQGQLHRDGGFCCLGVLCELHALATGGRWDYDGEEAFYHGESTVLPDVVVDWAGLNDAPYGHPENPTIDMNSGASLALLNDKGKPFWEIAVAIEENL